MKREDLKIHKEDNADDAAILRVVCTKTDIAEPWVVSVALEMALMMQSKDYKYMTANQIGYSCRMITLDTEQFEGVMVNPKITRMSDSVLHAKEECASLDNVWADTGIRSDEIEVSYYDCFDSKSKTGTYSGDTAVIIQHAIDHLNGKLFLDYLRDDLLDQEGDGH